MTVTSHVEQLRRKHQTLSEEVAEAQRNVGVDSLRVVELKKQKLRLKEEIERLQP